MSIGVLSSPLFFNKGKKSNYAGQAGVFVDYYWKSVTKNSVKSSLSYFAISGMFHPLGWSYGDGKGKGFALHGGFDVTCRIAGHTKSEIDGEEYSKCSIFDKDEMNGKPYKRFACGLSISADVILMKFYATVGYKLTGPVVKDINYSGMYMAIGYSF